ncbi:GNAT family N-acetyltransferase [Streptomyces fenghuangensis]|uniref:GNAT family N-acetyltransferase n=1 Tax=Streptomyces chitinivorans TaxID=1257027 RepID=A0ABW7HP97_9ACTN|nr:MULTISPECIES: GNAT family N-acetyltransferase [Streptomyces]MCG3040480.1 GNAT family N-acetyltransferase [Streptomyces sp. ICN903]MDH2411174.1 GNAT family N-acetyltransferase [Streptomyces chitinivorans]
MRITPVAYDHPDAAKLTDLVQLEYAERYGGEGDVTPLEPGMFSPPRGLFLIAYDERDRPVATGGWRAMDENGENYRDGDAELKRMFVIREARRQGLSRRILALLEEDAREAGRLRMVLETGTMQPEAMALYESSGYTLTEKFGVYRHEPGSRCYAKPLR